MVSQLPLRRSMPRSVSRYSEGQTATLCDSTLARANAKAGGATMIAGHLGSNEQFDAPAKYSKARSSGGGKCDEFQPNLV